MPPLKYNQLLVTYFQTLSENLTAIYASVLCNIAKKVLNDYKVTLKWVMVAQLAVKFGKILSYTHQGIF